MTSKGYRQCFQTYNNRTIYAFFWENTRSWKQERFHIKEGQTYHGFMLERSRYYILGWCLPKAYDDLTKSCRKAIVLGTAIPLALFLIWDAVILGTIPGFAESGTISDPLQQLRSSNGTVGVSIFQEVLMMCYKLGLIWNTLFAAYSWGILISGNRHIIHRVCSRTHRLHRRL